MLTCWHVHATSLTPSIQSTSPQRAQTRSPRSFWMRHTHHAFTLSFTSCANTCQCSMSATPHRTGNGVPVCESLVLTPIRSRSTNLKASESTPSDSPCCATPCRRRHSPPARRACLPMPQPRTPAATDSAGGEFTRGRRWPRATTAGTAMHPRQRIRRCNACMRASVLCLTRQGRLRGRPPHAAALLSPNT